MALGVFTAVPDGGLGTTPPTTTSLVSFPGDSSYATGGSAGFQAKIQALYKQGREVITVISGLCGGYRAVYDKTNDKLVVYAAGGAEVANAADLSAVTFNLAVITKLHRRTRRAQLDA